MRIDMCGISGYYSLNSEISLAKYYHAHSLLRHRGPDDEGFVIYKDNNVYEAKGKRTINDFSDLLDVISYCSSRMVLGHHRLSIIDLSKHGHQPMSTDDKRYWIVYNGEVYNYLELKTELESLGYSFQSNSDTEVFLKAFMHWGFDSFNKLNGMWAAAIYDRVDEKLILTRDRFGIKPLYYYIVNDMLYFGSEVKYLLPFVDDLQIDTHVASDYVVNCHLDHLGNTMFKNIFQLDPGHYAVYDGLSLKKMKYWCYNPRIDNDADYGCAVEKLRDLIHHSIDLRMRSDVPVGSFLSGGLDSSMIVCDLFDRNLIKKHSFQTFSAVFEEEEYNEKIYIDEVVEKTECNPHFIYPDSLAIISSIRNILHYQEFPFRSLAVFSQHSLYEYIKNNSDVKVILNGQGSDEIFGGYTSNYISLIGEYLRTWKIRHAYTETRHFSRARGWDLKKILLYVGRLIFPSISTYLLSILNYKKKLMVGDILLTKCASTHKDLFQQDLYCSLTFSALREYLRYEDRNSMAFSLETRLPFMDYRIIEFGYSLPNNFKIENGINKKILRKVAKNIVPDKIINRSDKMGFVSPQEEWQKTILKEYMDGIILKDKIEMEFPFLHAENIERLYNDYKNNEFHDWSLFWRVCCLYEWKMLWFNKNNWYVQES
jgi:asparagine synthase (glutamine-hydrolysing)